MSFYVYEIWDPLVNEPIYVGKGKSSKRDRRYRAHIRDALKVKEDGSYKCSTHKDNRIRKIIRLGGYPTIKIVFKTLNETRAFAKEMDLIKYYGRRDLLEGPLTNLTNGGEGVSGKIATEIERLRKSLSHMGSKNYMYGKKHTPRAIKKIANARRKRTTIYKHTKEWKEKLKDSPLILRTKENSSPIYQIDLSGTIIKKWSSANEAALFFKCNNGNIYTCAKYNHRICRGFYWIYERDAKIIDGKIVNIEELNRKRLTPHIANKIVQYSLDGTLIKIWPSYLSVDKELGLDYTILSNIILKKRKSNIYWGFIWKSPIDVVS
jgi:hypothetical protein